MDRKHIKVTIQQWQMNDALLCRIFPTDNVVIVSFNLSVNKNIPIDISTPK